MRIGIEAQRVFRKNKHGMDYVVLQEVRELQKMDADNEYFVYVKPGEDVCLTESDNVHIRIIGCPSYPLWEQYALPRAAKKDRVDILHCTSNTAPIFTKEIPLVLTLHDIIFFEPRDKKNKSLYQNMGWLYRRLVVPKILKKCRRIITVSDFERENILNKLQLPSKQVTRIYNGYNEWFTPEAKQNDAYSKYISEQGYFFFLGNTDPKKNTGRTLIAYAKYLEQSSIKRKLLVADLSAEYINGILKANGIEHIMSHISAPGYIVNTDLPSVYAGAFAFLYTSLRESFGIPLLEAMACDTPVITSSSSSMPEIAGFDAALIAPGDPDNIAAMMLKMESDTTFYETQKRTGRKRIQLFSWNKTASELLMLYQNVFDEIGGTNR